MAKKLILSSHYRSIFSNHSEVLKSRLELATLLNSKIIKKTQLKSYALSYFGVILSLAFYEFTDSVMKERINNRFNIIHNRFYNIKI